MQAFATNTKNAITLELVCEKEFASWQKKQSAAIKAQLKSQDFSAQLGNYVVLTNSKGETQSVVVGVATLEDTWALAGLPFRLPAKTYKIKNTLTAEQTHALSLGWGLAAYQFTRYKKARRKPAKLVLSKSALTKHMVAAIYNVRDLINTPCNDLGPDELEQFIKDLATSHQAKTSVIKGKKLETDFPAIHAVGKSSHNAPRLIELRWGKKSDPKVTLVGKGVCFDSGGLDIKPAAFMLQMKKDMGGAANAIGLAELIMAEKLPVNLRLLVPAVENLVDAHAFKPGDVIDTRKGLTVEIGNTDAEGRLILSDALTYACEESPDLLLDFATLTGAARVALGPDLSAVFSDHDETMANLLDAAEDAHDPCWRLPLYKPYKAMLKSPIADMNNVALNGFAGAITAALFLQSFVTTETPWVHFDIYAWNKTTKAGRPEGGEASGIKASFGLIKSFLSGTT